MSEQATAPKRHYELVILIAPGQSEKVREMSDRWRSTLEAEGGVIHRFEDWGRRALAYPINNTFKAHYLLINFECTVEAMRHLMESFQYNDAILRHLLLTTKRAVTTASAMTLECNKNHEGLGKRPGRLDANRVANIQYMDLDTLLNFVMETGRLVPSRMTGVSAKTQRRITEAVKLSRYLALLPYCDRHRL